MKQLRIYCIFMPKHLATAEVMYRTVTHGDISIYVLDESELADYGLAPDEVLVGDMMASDEYCHHGLIDELDEGIVCLAGFEYISRLTDDDGTIKDWAIQLDPREAVDLVQGKNEPLQCIDKVKKKRKILGMAM